MSPDRRVHASLDDQEVVRYDRAGKWYVEQGPRGRFSVRIHDAVGIAVSQFRAGGSIQLGLPGGGAFDSKVMRLLTDEELDRLP